MRFGLDFEGVEDKRTPFTRSETQSDMNTAQSNGRSRGMIIRVRDPLNLEFPFDELAGPVTDVDSFYIRSHFPVPDLGASHFTLQIDGAVSRPFNVSLDELRAMPGETRLATLECAGNSRIFLSPSQEGVQWELGAIGTAEWTGVRLSLLLEQAGLKPGVCEIVLEGADRGAPTHNPKPPQEIAFARSIPVQKALQPEVLVAYQMNGRDLPPDHGYPVRAIVPGYYGMSSVKWLTGIHAVENPFFGYWQTSDYGYWDNTGGLPVRRPLSTMKLKSAIARPRMYQNLRAGEQLTIFGAAWTGSEHIAKVEVSTDGGSTWRRAELLDPPSAFAWQRWSFEWPVPEKSGRYVLLSRATDSSGNAQPLIHDRNYGSYAIHHCLPIHVFVD
jgi:DMSO/TMAO reductase YedYZ molybdopterin-dependent catalytic subunit